jgi:hypothetical protein
MVIPFMAVPPVVEVVWRKPSGEVGWGTGSGVELLGNSFEKARTNIDNARWDRLAECGPARFTQAGFVHLHGAALGIDDPDLADAVFEVDRKLGQTVEATGSGRSNFHNDIGRAVHAAPRQELNAVWREIQDVWLEPEISFEHDARRPTRSPTVASDPPIRVTAAW